MDKTTYMRNKVINVMRNQAFAAIPTLYLALFITVTTSAGGGTELTAGGFAYARQAVTLGAPSDGLSFSTNTQPFVNHPAATIVDGALFDASSGGNMLYHGPWSSPIILLAGGTTTIAVGDVFVQEQ